MMRLSKYSLALVVLAAPASFSACVKNSIEVEAVKDGCRWLGIDNGQYNLIDDPCEDGYFNIESSCSHNEDTACIQFLKVNPVFYNEFNEEIPLPNVSRVYQGAQFFLSESVIAFEYDYQIADQSSPQTKANYAVLTYLVENEFEDQSNELSLRVHFPCTVINDDDYTVINPDSIITVDRTPGTFPIEFWDNAAEDGDLIAAYVNGNVLVEKLEIFHERKRYDVSKDWLVDGKNDIIVFALNEGSSGPNTVSMSVNGKDMDLGGFAKGLRTGNAVQIDF